jgi:hypothetical protein
VWLLLINHRGGSFRHYDRFITDNYFFDPVGNNKSFGQKDVVDGLGFQIHFSSTNTADTFSATSDNFSECGSFTQQNCGFNYPLKAWPMAIGHLTFLVLRVVLQVSI